MSDNPSSERPPIIEQLRAESRGLPYRPAKRKKSTEPCRPSPEDSHRLLTIEKGNRWLELARREPPAKMLLGELWHQGELCMLFADTNAGKSVLAVQIGESIARGQGIASLTCQAPPARVLYIDFELSQAQFGLRYSNGGEDHQFPDNFFRAQYNFIADPPPNVDENELLIAAIEYKIKLCKATVLIIDNITCLRGGTENSAVALSLMKSLKALKTDYNLSVLVLAHTPKRRNATQPISADDLHGSKLLINLADSAFAIGKSTTDAGLCYLKQIKQRNTSQRYGADNVCLCRIQKPGSFLHFVFEGNSAERHHLLSRTAADRREIAVKIAALSAAGHSQRDISRQLDIGLATVNRLLKCANVKICGCADEGRCADVQIRECADEDGDVPMTNDVMTNDQNRCADEVENIPMTNDVMTNDQNRCADEDENIPMTNDLMTNDQNGCADGGGHTNELITNDLMTNDQNADAHEVTPMTNDIMTNDQNRCADEKRCANVQMCGFADEGEDVPMTNDAMTNDQNRCADEDDDVPMTNEVMTNDQNRCADEDEVVPMTNDVLTNDQNRCADEDENIPMTNDLMTNDQNGCADDDGDVPMTNDVMTNDQNRCADEEENIPMTNDVMTNDQNRCADEDEDVPMTNDVLTNDQNRCADEDDDVTMTNDLMTNDQNRYADEKRCANVQMCKCADMQMRTKLYQ